MDFTRTGFILYTINYNDCIQFYEHILKLTVLFKTKELTCFSFGDSYLMVELDSPDSENSKEDFRIKTCLRMNVPNVKHLADKLISKGIKVNYQEHSWGTIAKFFDPDGNLCAFKDDYKFEKQITSYNS